MMSEMNLSDIAAVTRAEGSGGYYFMMMILLFAIIFGGGGLFGNRGDYGTYATAASQQEILFGQQFSNLDNKMDRGFTSIGNGIADATFAINNAVKDGNYATQSAIKDCCCTTQRNIDSVRYDMANFASAIQANDTANTQKILDAISQNKIDTLRDKVNQLEMQNAMCGVVRYPTNSAWAMGGNPFCNCNCGNNNI